MASDGDDVADDDEQQDEQPDATPPKFPFNAETTDCVLDVRTLAALPQDSDEDGAAAFRALLLPKGKTVHVPGASGCYATIGPWRTQLVLSLVHFEPSTKRKPELLLLFVDYGMLNSDATGMFVASLQPPLQKSRNVFEETARFSKITDVVGFTPIDVKIQPWCALLEPALKRQALFEADGIFSPADILIKTLSTYGSLWRCA